MSNPPRITAAGLAESPYPPRYAPSTTTPFVDQVRAALVGTVTPAHLRHLVTTFQGDDGRWGFTVQCPDEEPYTSPAIYDTEDAACSEGANDLYLCLYPTGQSTP